MELRRVQYVQKNILKTVFCSFSMVLSPHKFRYVRFVWIECTSSRDKKKLEILLFYTFIPRKSPFLTEICFGYCHKVKSSPFIFTLDILDHKYCKLEDLLARFLRKVLANSGSVFAPQKSLRSISGQMKAVHSDFIRKTNFSHSDLFT